MKKCILCVGSDGMNLRQEEFEVLALAAISEIPFGKVATYLQIAEMIGYPKHARHVGNACANSWYYGSFPCHRVVNSQGRLVPGWDEQRALLEEEGIPFKKNGYADLKLCQWK